jgi:DNA-binding Xre family transcriptional regulator
MAAKRKVSYQWRLREVMAAAGLFNASDLEPLLAERGITLSSVQVWRLVTGTPERLSLPVLAALCDIFDVTPAELIATRAENIPARRRAASSGGDEAGVTELNAAPGPRPATAPPVSGGPKKRTCARCGHHGYPAASFPEGHLCHRCLNTALAVVGTCPGCGTANRVLPGLRDGARICRDCAGITRHFSCLRCDTEAGMAGRRHGSSRLCGPCAVTWTAEQLLDDGTGTISAPLKPLAGALAATTSPAGTLEWLGQPHIRDLLTRLATRQLPLTHQALDAWPRPRATGYLRDLLISCGVLPAADKQLLDYQAWLDRRLASLASHPTYGCCASSGSGTSSPPCAPGPPPGRCAPRPASTPGPGSPRLRPS